MGTEPRRVADLRLIGQGREAEIFDWEPGKVLRLCRDAAAAQGDDRQSAGLAAAWAAGAPVPRPYERVVLEGRVGLVMDRADGPDILTELGRKPWTLFWAGRTLGRIHAQINAVVAPPELPEARADLRERIGFASDVLPSAFVRYALKTLDALPDGDRLCHGDYHPGNVIVTREGPKVIDWTLAARGDPTADLARGVMVLELGEPPPGASVIVRVGEKFGRPLLFHRYLRAYRRVIPVDAAALDRWKVVQAAARFNERIESEYPALERLIESHSRGATT